MRRALTIAAREARSALGSPVAWIVLVLFLVVQGFSFFAVLKVVADPHKPSPYGAVLRTHFGGTFLYWAFLFFVVATLTMRVVAEERRQGTWETLRTVPVGDGAVIVGKWLGVLAFYAFLWLPTLAYPLILAAFAPPGAGPDLGPIATAYLGVFVTGAAFLAVGVAASALTSSQVVAAAATFVPLLALLLIGVLPEVAPDTFARHTTAAALARALDVRRHMDDFARGVVDLRHVAFHAGLAAVALWTATVTVAAERRPRRERGQAVLAVLLAAAIGALANVEAARHPVRFDATRAQVYTLDPKTRQILADVHRPVRALVLTAGRSEFAPLYDEVRELLRRFQAENPLIGIEELDPSLDPGRIGELAAEHALRPEELAGGGAVVMIAGDRHRAVALLDMAEFGQGPGGGGLRAFRGEAELAAAVLEVSDEARPEICFTSGHGELPLADNEGQDLAAIVRALERDAERAAELTVPAEIPPRCVVVAVVGPRKAFTPAEARALEAYLAGGGRLFVAVDPELDATGRGFLPLGIEGVLERHGVKLRAGVVVDPSQEFGIPLAWGTWSGYGDHPVVAAFRGRRATAWYEPRWVEPLPVPGVTSRALIRSSESGWAETDLASLGKGRADARPDDSDEAGPVAIAVAAEAEGGARLIVVGSARSFATSVIDKGGFVDDAFMTSAMAWLTGRHKLTGVGPKTPEQARVVISVAQEGRLFWLSVAGLPGLAAIAGFLWLRRRRRAR